MMSSVKKFINKYEKNTNERKIVKMPEDASAVLLFFWKNVPEFGSCSLLVVFRSAVASSSFAPVSTE